MIPYAEFYNYDRLESAAVELGLLQYRGRRRESAEPA